MPLKFITETNKIPSGKNVALSIVNNRIADKIDIRTIFDQFVHQFPPPLRWIKFFKDGKLTAEVLMSAEFVQLPVPTLNVRVMEKNEQIPVEIRPDMKKFRLEITFAGIRNAQNLVLFSSGRYKIEVTIGELSLISGFSGKSYDTNLNFLDPYASGYLLLPEQFQFWPPIIIKHLDCSNSKHPKVLGAAMIRRPEKFFIEEKSKGIQRFLLHQKIDDDTQKAETRIDIAETEPLLGISNINERKKTIQHTVNNLKFLKFLQVSNMGNPNDGMSLEHQYTWWTKFHNSNRVRFYF